MTEDRRLIDEYVVRDISSIYFIDTIL